MLPLTLPHAVAPSATMAASNVISVFTPIDPRIGELRDKKVAQRLAMEAQMQEECKAREEEERTGVVWLWTQVRFILTN